MTGYASKKAAANAKLEQAKEILLQHPQKDIDWQREQQIKAHAKLDDDDIQVCQKPWVGLTAEDFSAIKFPIEMRFPAEFRAGARWAEAKLKEKNSLQ